MRDSLRLLCILPLMLALSCSRGGSTGSAILASDDGNDPLPDSSAQLDVGENDHGDSDPGAADASDPGPAEPSDAEDGAGADGADTPSLPRAEVVAQELLPEPANFVLRSLWAPPGGPMFAVGQDGVVLRREEPGTWSFAAFRAFPYLHGVDGAALNHAFAVGLDGVRIPYDGETWGGVVPCVEDKDCEDGDPCTRDLCVNRGCVLEPTGMAGCCGGTAMSEDFDGAGVEETLEIEDLLEEIPNAGGMVWHVVALADPFSSKPRSTSPPSALYFGDPEARCAWDESRICPTYNNDLHVAAQVTLPEIQLPVAPRVNARFKVFLDVDYGTFDELTLEVVGGGTSTEVWSKTELEESGVTYERRFVGVEVDLSAHAGQAVRLRFVFDSKDQFVNLGEGVYVDDLVVDSACMASGLPAQERLSTFFDVAATPSGRYYAVGLQGSIWRYDPLVGWEDVGSGSRGDWHALDASAESLLVGGAEGRLVERSDGVFKAHEGDPAKTIRAVRVFDDGSRVAVGDAGLVLFAPPGDGFSPAPPVPTAANLLDVDGPSASDLSIVGSAGTILRFAGGAFAIEGSPVVSELRGVTVMQSGQRYAVGDMGVRLIDDGNGWVELPVDFTDAINAVDSHGATTVLAAGDYGSLLRLDPSTGSLMREQPPVSRNFTDVLALGHDDIWVTGVLGALIHYDGVEWSQVELDLGVDLRGIAGPSSARLYLIAAEGLVLSLEGGELSEVISTTTATLRSAFALDDSRVWLSGGGGTILSGSETLWQRQRVEPLQSEEGEPIPIEDPIYGVWASAPDKAWAVGGGGRVLHWDGEIWKSAQNEDPRTLRAVRGRADDDVYAVGAVGAVLHFDGESWAAIETDTVATLHDLGFAEDGSVVVIGDAGTVLRLK